MSKVKWCDWCEKPFQITINTPHIEIKGLYRNEDLIFDWCEDCAIVGEKIIEKMMHGDKEFFKEQEKIYVKECEEDE